MTRVRISAFFPLIFVVLAFRIDDLNWAITTGIVLFVMTVIHEFGHVFSARLTGGHGDDILVWPLGGLASVQTGFTLFSRVMVPLAGPLVHFVACLLLTIPLANAGLLSEALSLLTLTEVDFSRSSTLQTFLVLAFKVNYALMLLNLIPVFPLDGGQILQAILNHSRGTENATQIYVRVGTVIGLLILLGGLLLDSTGVTAFGAVILVLNMQETMRLRSGESFEDSFMGYDFSQGYTSLEREEMERPPRKSALQRWRDKRQQEREERERVQAAEEKRMVDIILDKLHANGKESLTDSERAILDRASARLRKKDGS